MVKKKQFDNKLTAKLYNKRYEKHGRSIKTVGWGSKSDQFLRFDILFRDINIKGKKILDIGCGLGDMVEYINFKTDGDFEYIGIDIAKELINDSKKKFIDYKNVKFLHGDIFSIKTEFVDLAVLSGALSFKTPGIKSYAYKTMKAMYNISDHSCSLNFLSKYVDYKLNKNVHFNPGKVLNKAKLTKKVNLFHDYPLYEFTIQLFK